MLSTYIVTMALGFSFLWGGLLSGFSQSAPECVPYQPGLEIPEDNTWLSVCITDPVAPENGTVSSVSIKYVIEDPDPNLLEIRLSKKDAKAESNLWEPKNLKGSQFGRANALPEWTGVAAKGDWILRIHNTGHGKKNKLIEVELAIDYTPMGPALIPISEGAKAGRTVSLRLPEGTVLSDFHEANSDKSEPITSSPTADAVLASTSGWQQIISEPFEGAFPNSKWRVADSNGYYPSGIECTYDREYGSCTQYLWDRSDFKKHNGTYAAWPARGGANGRGLTNVNVYKKEIDSWMIYGPIDLRDAKAVEISYYLWHHVEPVFDYFYFGIATVDPGSSPRIGNFTGEKYSLNAEYWDTMDYKLNPDDFKDTPTVYLAWYFHSDSSTEYDGPWVDDISVRKYVPGQVTVQGNFSYTNRWGNKQPAKDVRVELYDIDPNGSEDLLATELVNQYGDFQFPALDNWDDDYLEQTVEEQKLDLKVKWIAIQDYAYPSPTKVTYQVTNFSKIPYYWESSTQTNIGDGTTEFTLDLSDTDTNIRSMWLFQDIRWAREFWLLAAPQLDPGSVTVRWQYGAETFGPCLGGSCFYAGDEYNPYVFISYSGANRPDEVAHEVGHAIMYNLTNNWHAELSCLHHSMWSEESQSCAFSEGWADFFAVVSNGDVCYDFDKASCGGTSYNLELPNVLDQNSNPPNPYKNYPHGDDVEGRVASALLDLMDTNNDAPYDKSSVGFASLAYIMKRTSKNFGTFWYFYHFFKANAGEDEHRSVQSIYQNTIDYDDAPIITNTTRGIPQNMPRVHLVDLWEISSDYQSNDFDLRFQVLNVSDARCKIVLDANRWLNATPLTGWTGSCNITVSVSDSIKSSTGIVHIDVYPVAGRNYLPVVIKD